MEKELRLGNLDAKRDWGFAGDYVKAMWQMLQQSEPDDYVIATNETHSVKEFAKKAFEYVDLNWQDYVIVDEMFYRPAEVNQLKGNYDKSKQKLKWEPTVTLEELIIMMMKADLKNIGHS